MPLLNQSLPLWFHTKHEHISKSTHVGDGQHLVRRNVGKLDLDAIHQYAPILAQLDEGRQQGVGQDSSDLVHAAQVGPTADVVLHNLSEQRQ